MDITDNFPIFYLNFIFKKKKIKNSIFKFTPKIYQFDPSSEKVHITETDGCIYQRPKR